MPASELHRDDVIHYQAVTGALHEVDVGSVRLEDRVARWAAVMTDRLRDEEAEKLQYRVMDAEKKVQDLKNRLGAAETKAGTLSMDAINDPVRSLRKEREDLSKRQAALERQTVALRSKNERSKVPVPEWKTMEGVHVVLMDNQVLPFCIRLKLPDKEVIVPEKMPVPVDTPYFSGDVLPFPGQTVIIIKKIRSGLSAKNALAANGYLDRLLATVNRTNQYVSLQVASNSVSAFREIVAEIGRRNQDAAASGAPRIRFSWETWKDPCLVPVGGGGPAPASGVF